jgi:hypothetical protein
VKKTLATILITLFTLAIIVVTSQAGKVPQRQGDVAGAIGELVGMLLWFVGLFYSIRWNIKLHGHTYKLGRQTWAALLFWYSVLAAFIGLDMIAFEHNSFGLTPGSIMLVLWSGMAYICRRWQKRLLGAERAQQSTVPQSQPA